MERLTLKIIVENESHVFRFGQKYNGKQYLNRTYSLAKFCIFDFITNFRNMQFFFKYFLNYTTYLHKC